MASRSAFLVSGGLAISTIVAACGGATESPSFRGGALGTDAGSGGASTGGAASGGRSSNGGASNGGATAGGSSNGGASNGGANAGGASNGGTAGAGTGGRATGGGGSSGGGGTAGSTGGANTGGAVTDGGPCNVCLPTYDLHWGQNGGLGPYDETSRLGPCAAYSRERTPRFTDPPSLMCNTTLSTCPGSPLADIVQAFTTTQVQNALAGHTLYGNDPRPVDGQVFEIGVGNDFIDVGPNCESNPSSCPNMPEPVARLVKLLRDLDTTMLAQEPCKSTFGGGNVNCGGTTCAVPGQVCIAERTVGGGLIMLDAGRCPPGTHIETIGTSFQICAADYAYQCVNLAGCNPGSVSCSCGAAMCPSRYPHCSNPSSSRVALDPDAQLVCELQAP